jgi:carbohydrate kinase (thermoresistant glucokinase family)
MAAALRLVVMGVCASGKSALGAALAERLGLPFVEGDSFHSPENVALMAEGTPLTDARRAGWLRALAAQMGSPAACDSGMVLACSALKRSYRDVLRSGAPDLRLLLLHGSRELLQQRLAARQGHYMPASLLPSQLATLEMPQPDEHALVLDTDRPLEQLTKEALRYLRTQQHA